MRDPLQDLAPFLEQARQSSREFEPPDFLTVRLMQTRDQVLEPAVLPRPEEPSLPRDFGPYQLEAVLGQGASGTVYRAYDEELERSIAVMVLAPQLALTPDAAIRFLREARAMAKLSDDNLMPLLSVHQDTPSPCLTMPLLTGGTLQRKIEREGVLAADEVTTLGAQICQGLLVAHQAGLVHRDLKPSNIFLEETTHGTRARLMDFGLAKMGEDTQMTREGEVAGTPSFMAPEQIDGLPSDGRADLYGLGATLFMALTGRPPFEGSTLTATLRQVATEAAPSVSEIAPATPAWLARLVSDLLAKEPSNRPEDAEEVLRRLAEQKNPVMSLVGASRLRGLAMLSLAAGLALGLFLFFGSRSKQSPEPTFSTRPLVVQLASFQTGDTLAVGPGEHLLPSIDLGGKNLKLVGSDRGSRLVFANLAQPAFLNAGDLELVNLTIDCSRPGQATGVPLVSGAGAIKLRHCRIEQAPASGQFPDQAALLETGPDTETLISNCEFYTFSAIIWRMKGRAKLTVRDSLIFSPGLVYASDEIESEGAVFVQNSTCLHQIGFSHVILAEEATRIEVELENSLVECSHALLWFPLGDEATLRDSFIYQRRDTVFFLSKGLIRTSLCPRGTGLGGALDRWREPRWREFWGEGEERAQMRGDSLIMREAQNLREPRGLGPEVITVPARLQGKGANLTQVGPES